MQRWPQATPRAPGTLPRERSDRARAAGGGHGGVILVVDADSVSASAVADVLTRDGHIVELAASLKDVDADAFDAFDVAVVAVVDAGVEPVDVVDAVRAPGRQVEVIVISNRNDVDAAVAALHHGASDFLVKPVAPQRLRLALGRALERRRLLRENERLQRDLSLLQTAQRLLEHLEPAELAAAGVEALVGACAASAAAIWSKDIRAARHLSDDEANRLWERDGPAGFVEHHTGEGLGLGRLAVVMLLDLAGGMSAAVGFAVPPTTAQQEALFFLSRQLSTAFGNAARYRDAADQALRDPLTGLWNATAFSQSLDRLMQGEERPFTLLFLDLDHFKQVNDRFGHLVGSRAIVAAAVAVLGQVREGDVVARYGGDELVVLLPAADGDVGEVVGERIRRAVAAVRLPDCEGLEMTVSIGVACAPGDADDATGLIEAADRGLYQAKGASRNRVCRAPRP